MKPPAPRGEEKFRVLAIEDDPEIAKLVLTYLAHLNFDCRHAADGPAGWEEFKRSAPHLVLLDLLLPGLSGNELLARLRETSTVPVIVLTALTEEGLQSFKTGADDFVTKPFDPKLLVARVVAHLRRAYKYDNCEEAETVTEEESDEDVLIPEARQRSSPVTSSQQSGAVPYGWATCEYCGYMGPRERFEHEDATGKRGLLCPVCQESDQVVFSIG